MCFNRIPLNTSQTNYALVGVIQCKLVWRMRNVWYANSYGHFCFYLLCHILPSQQKMTFGLMVYTHFCFFDWRNQLKEYFDYFAASSLTFNVNPQNNIKQIVQLSAYVFAYETVVLFQFKTFKSKHKKKNSTESKYYICVLNIQVHIFI